jgi:hypothetical protein
MVGPDRQQQQQLMMMMMMIIIRRMHSACWITKATEYVAYYFSMATVVTRTRLNVTIYVCVH